MNARALRLNPPANGLLVCGFPNVRSATTDRNAILRGKNFFHVLGVDHFYKAHDAVTIPVPHDVGMQNGTDLFKGITEAVTGYTRRKKSHVQLRHGNVSTGEGQHAP